MSCRLVGLLLLSTMLLPAAEAQRSTQIKEAIANGLMDVAEWCASNDLQARAKTHTAEARSLSSRNNRMRTLWAKVRGNTDKPAPHKRYDRIWKSAAKKLGGYYLALFKCRHETSAQNTWDGYLVRAYRLNPAKSQRTFEKEWRKALKDKDRRRVHRLLSTVSDIKTSERIAAARKQALDDAAPPAVRIARTLTRLAQWCVAQDHDEEAGFLLAEALHHDPRHQPALDLKPKLKATDSPSKQTLTAYSEKRKTLAPELSRLYLERHQEKANDLYLSRAYQLNPAVVEPLYEAAWKKAHAAENWKQLHQLLQYGRNVAVDETLGAARAQAVLEGQRKIATTTPVMRTADGHRMKYWISLPKGWRSDKKWPVLVACDGRLCIFRKRCDSFVKWRKDRPFIIVSPCTFANTNDLKKILTSFKKDKGFGGSKPTNKYKLYREYLTPEAILSRRVEQLYPDTLIDFMNPRHVERAKFDRAGLVKVLAEVQARFSGTAKCFITGWSGGGMLTWSMVFAHPEMLYAAAPACANCMPELHRLAAPNQKFSQAPERVDLPIVAFQGLKDRYLKLIMNPQWEAAKRATKALGYKNVKRINLPKKAHADCVREVLDFFEKTWKQKASK